MSVEETLRAVGAAEFVGGLQAWGGQKKLTPYNDDDIVRFSRITAAENDREREGFDRFKTAWKALSLELREEARAWIQRTFVDPVWAEQGRRFRRPEFAAKKFFVQAVSPGQRLLDVAPDRGTHGLLLYRDHYHLAYEYSCADALPSHSKLLVMLGVEAEHYNARHDSLTKVFEGTFDVVTCTEFLEHVEQAAEDRILADLHVVTDRGSRLLITFPEHAVDRGVEPDTMGHVRQPDTDAIVAALSGFRELERGLFEGGKTHQRYLIAERR